MINVYKDIMLKNLYMKYSDMYVNLLQITGIGRKTVEKTIAEYKKSITVTSPNLKRCKKSLFHKIDDLYCNGQNVYSIWLQHELPIILTAVNEESFLPTLKRITLYTTTKKLELVIIKKKRCSVWAEKKEFIVERRSYLYDIRKF